MPSLSWAFFVLSGTLMRKSFVCVINRDRDGYEVPLALQEAGLLASFVTDFYAGENPSPLVPRRLRKRTKAGLPKQKVRSGKASFALQLAGEVLGLDMGKIFPLANRMLARKGLSEARRLNSHLYCYSAYLPNRPAKDRKVIDFEYHPHPQLTFPLLEKDHAQFPETAESFARERAMFERQRTDEGWQSADAVVCASTMTRRTLEHVGCPPERITVIPYGFVPRLGTAPDKQSGPCRFLFVGQGVQRKGLHHLIRCWQALDPPDAELTLVCYHIDPAIEALIDSPSIRLLRQQPRNELDALFAQADVFVMPSLIEGFGLVYLEALQAGCHVLATTNTGVPDLPLDRAAATVIEPGDLDALTYALRKLVQAKRHGQLDQRAIAAQAGCWTWADFRAAIARHAESVIA